LCHLLGFGRAEAYLMDISQMVKEFGPTADFHRFCATRMATLMAPVRGDIANDMSLPLTDVGMLLKSILWFRVVVTEAFGTQARPDEVVTELNDVALQ
jgi:hypothetical protein